MKNSFKSLGLIASGLAAISPGYAQLSKPNIIYILADDMGYGDIKALNPDSKIPTPNLDKMVSEGINFSNAHSNSAVSTPTRYGTLTGHYTFRTSLKSGVLTGYSPALIDKERKTVATLLQDNGYNTACIGKWHLGLDWPKKDTEKPLFEGSEWDIKDLSNVDYTARVGGVPNDNGFDYTYIIPASLDIPPYVYIENGQITAPVNEHCEAWRSDEARGMWYRHGDIADGFKHETCLQTFTDRACDYIDSASKEENPFFLFFPLTAPHTPWLPAEEFRGKSGAGVYGDFVCMIDDVVAKVYKALEDNGIAENTIVIFTSDNGSHWIESDIEKFGHRANHVFSGYKSDIWQGGHRVPYVLTYPQLIAEGRESTHLVSSTDLIATVADLIGVELEDDMGEDSYSFLSEITEVPNKDFPKRESMIYHSIDGYFGFHQGDMVLLNCKGSGGWFLPENKAKDLSEQQLYNLKNDITEKNNVIHENEELAKKMFDTLQSQIEGGRSR